MIDLIDPDRIFALDHVRAAERPAVAALWALDEQLGQIVASTTQPMVGQMRLTWWREALETRVSGHPVLAAMESGFARGIDVEGLGILIDGWEELLEPLPLDAARLAAFAEARGGQLFAMTARICDVSRRRRRPGRDGRWPTSGCGARTRKRHRGHWRWPAKYCSEVNAKTLPRSLRVLVRLARLDVAAGRRVERTAWKLFRSIA